MLCYRGLENLNSYHSGPSGNMINMLFGVSTPSPPLDFISNLPEKGQFLNVKHSLYASFFERFENGFINFNIFVYRFDFL